MTESPTKHGLRIMPSPGDALFLGVFFFVVALRNSLLETPSTARHILTGKLILDSLHILRSDPFSFATAGGKWVCHDWLSEVLFAGLYRFTGYNGIIVLVGLCIGVTMYLMFRFMLRRDVSVLIAAPMVALAAVVINTFVKARPEIFSLLFTLLFFIILDLFQQEGINWLWALPFLMVLWANLTGDFAAGVGLIIFYIGCNAVIAIAVKEKEKRETCVGRCKRLGVSLGLVIAASFINPIGPAILPFQFRLARTRFFTDNFTEWLSPNFSHYYQAEILLLVLIAAFSFSRRRADLVETGLLLVTVCFGLLFAAYFPLIVVIVTPIAAVLISHSLDKVEFDFNGRTRKVTERLAGLSTQASAAERFRNPHIFAAAIVVLWSGLAVYGARTGLVHFTDRQDERRVFPVDALQFARANAITGNLFNFQAWGGYILLNSYPRYKVFMDDRYEMYDASLIDQYVKVVNVERDFAQVLDQNDINWALLKANTPISQVLFYSGWKLVYADGVADVFVRNCPENSSLISKYPNVNFVPDGFLRVDEYDEDPAGTAYGHTSR